MLIKIDTRESDLFKCCETVIESVPKFGDIKLISETLPLGDIILNDGVNDCIIIERKTLSDLGASIKDGRYEEQSYRLNGLDHHNHNIIYLIEGDMSRFNAFKERIDKQTLYSAMFSILYFKGFSVMQTSNINETATQVCNMVYKLVSGLKAGKRGFYPNVAVSAEALPNDAAPKSEKEYCSVVKKVKKDNVTRENIGEIMLCQIPGISSASAIAILNTFKTLPNLIQCLKEDETCLNSITTVDSNGKSRKISKTAIASIVEYLRF